MAIRTQTKGSDWSKKIKESYAGYTNESNPEESTVYSEPVRYSVNSNSSELTQAEFRESFGGKDLYPPTIMYTTSNVPTHYYYEPQAVNSPRAGTPPMNYSGREIFDQNIEYVNGNTVVCCHPIPDYHLPSGIIRDSGSSMSMYGATPGGTQGSPRCGSVVYYNPTPTGYSNGVPPPPPHHPHSHHHASVCAPPIGQPTIQGTENTTSTTTTPWMYAACGPSAMPPSTLPPGSYPYHAVTTPFIPPPPSGYPIVCPPPPPPLQPVFYRIYPSGMSPRLTVEEQTKGGGNRHRRSYSSTYPSTTSTPRAVNRVESMTESRSKQEMNKLRGFTHDHRGSSRANGEFVQMSTTIEPPRSSSARTDSACLADVSDEESTTAPKSAMAVARTRTENLNDEMLLAFKASKREHFTLKDIYGHLFNFCVDQAGSRFLQEQLAVATVEEVDAVHVELAPNMSTLMKDVFGNYIVQILLQSGSTLYRQPLAQTIKDNTLELTLHVYGCRVVQKALEVLKYNEKYEIMSNLERHIARCVKDMNGNHVIQKAIREMSLEDIPFVLDTVHERGLSFAVHPYGCRVVQRILECDCTAMEQLLTKENIMNKVVDNVEELSQDLYGNYVVQHVLRYSNVATRRRAVDALMASPIDFACHKFASNVVETAVLYSSTEERMKIVNAIVYASDRGDRIDPLSLLTTNRFGNYVVQKLLDVVEDESKTVLLSSITSRMKILKRFKYGKHIVNRVEKMLAESNTTGGDK